MSELPCAELVIQQFCQSLLIFQSKQFAEGNVATSRRIAKRIGTVDDVRQVLQRH